MKTISLDIQHNLHPQIDVSDFFGISAVHAIDNSRFKTVLDSIPKKLPRLSFVVHQTVEVEDFETIFTLDLTHNKVLQSPFWIKKFPYIQARKTIIDMSNPVETPRFSLDIRNGQKIPSTKTYPDLFYSPLSVTERFSRFCTRAKRFLVKRKSHLAYGALMIVMFFSVWFLSIKFSLENAYTKLVSLSSANNITTIKSTISSAKSDFDRAKFLFLPLSWIPGETIDTGNRAISGGQKVLSAINSVVSQLPDNDAPFALKITENGEDSEFRGHSKDIAIGEALGIDLPTNWIAENNSTIQLAINDIIESGDIFAGASGDSHYTQKLQKAGKVIHLLAPMLQEYSQNSDILLKMLGHTEPHRYMIFNQNRDEIRANGGFPGSIISFTLYKGNVLDYRTDDVYYYDWNLYPHKELPPPGIALLTNNYGLRDVNYYPDFLQTLDKANSFVEKSGDSTLTTAIAIHQGVVEDILGIIGPVYVEGVEEPFTKENFSLLMSFLVENKFAKEKTPKDILFKFISAFGKQVVESKKLDEVIISLSYNWQKGEFLVASRNSEIQSFLQTIQKPLPWNSQDKNWVYPVFTSISGNKSDRYMQRSLEVKTQKMEQCNYETSLYLKHKHTFSEEDKKQVEDYIGKFGIADPVEKEKMRFIQGNGLNKNFVRILLPKGVKVTTPGLDIASDEVSTSVSFVLETPVGKESQKTITYTQNIPNCDTYSGDISVYKQPGLQHFMTP